MRQYLTYYKSIIKLALPVIISQVGGMTVGLADTIMVGQLGAKPLAAVAFANSLSWVIYLFGMGLAMGLTPLVGRAFARGDGERLGSLLRNSFFINVCVGVLFTFVILGLSLAMPLMGQDPTIIPDARAYIFFQILSALPIMLFSTAKQFLEGIGNTAYSMWITISANAMNIGLNWIFIYGNWGFPAMGASGAGASTLVARVYMVFMFLGLMYFRREYREYLQLAVKATFCKFRMRRLFNVGFPIATQLSIEMASISMMALVIGTFGAESLAGHNVAINIPSMSFMVVTGLAAATTVLVSQDYALRLYDRIQKTLRAALHLVIGYMIISAIVIVSLATPIASIFSPDTAVIAVASHLLIFGALFQLSDGIQGVVVGALRGLVAVKKPMIYALIVYVVIAPIVSYLFAFVLGMGPAGTWVSFIISLTILAVLYLRLFNKLMRNLR